MASIMDVAAEAGVAPSTVSLVANGKSRVSPRMRKHVEGVMDKLNWRPRAIGENTQKPHHVGVLYGQGMILDGELVDYCRKWISGLRESFADGGSHLTVNVGAKHIDNDLIFKQSLNNGDFDGVVMMGVLPEDEYLNRTLQAKVPTVVMNKLPYHQKFSTVRADAWEGGRLAAQHLLELGHQRIAVMLWKKGSEIESAYELRNGFIQALSAQGIEPIFDLDDNPPAGVSDADYRQQVAKQLLDAGVTACFTGDPVGQRLANAFEKLGVDVPGAFSILGWDDLGLKTKSGKRLSSIGYDKKNMGLLAGRMLKDLLAMPGEIINMNTTVAVHLNGGQTTAPPGRVCCAHQSGDGEKTFNKKTNTPALEPELVPA